MQKVVKWGVLGTANIAKVCTIPGMKLAESCELYAIAGRNLEKAESFKEEFGFEKAYGSYEELLDDPDVQAVFIPLPNNLHCKRVTETLKKGKHVLCEKPLGLNAGEVREMHKTAEENGVYLMEAYVKLFRQGESTFQARKDLLCEVRTEIQAQLDKYQSAMDRLNYKISRYDEAIKTGVLSFDPGKCGDQK